MNNKIDMFNTLRKCFNKSIPFIYVKSVDEIALIDSMANQFQEVFDKARDGDNSKVFHTFRWNPSQGAVTNNKITLSYLEKVFGNISSKPSIASQLLGNDDDSSSLEKATKSLPDFLDNIVKSNLQDCIIFLQRVHSFIGKDKDTEAIIVQNLINMRDYCKSRGVILCFVSPIFNMPIDVKDYFVEYEEEYPDQELIKSTIVNHSENYVNQFTDLTVLGEDEITKIAGNLRGVSLFAADQSLALAVGRGENGKVVYDKDILSEHRENIIKSTQGLSLYKGTETFNDIGGVRQAKKFLGNLKPSMKDGVCVVLEEIEKTMGGISGDSSGVSQDFLGTLLGFMQDNKVRGFMFYGVQGTAKSATAKALGNELGLPTINLDVNGTKSRYVGDSESNLRQALKVIKGIGGDNLLFVATSNKTSGLPTELLRRFQMAKLFFDIPTNKELESIWKIYIKKYGFKKQPLPDSINWTGSEVEACCDIANMFNISLVEASAMVVPIAVTAQENINQIRKEADGKFLSATHDGIYKFQALGTYNQTEVKSSDRKYEEV